MALKIKNPTYLAGIDIPETAPRDPERLSPRAAVLVIFAISVALWSIIAEAARGFF